MTEAEKITVAKDWIQPTDKQIATGRLGGWAPGNYVNKCIECGVHHIAAKRSINCFACAAVSALVDREAYATRLASEAAADMRAIVCEEWQAFASTKGVTAEALVASILNRFDALPLPDGASEGRGGVLVSRELLRAMEIVLRSRDQRPEEMQLLDAIKSVLAPSPLPTAGG